MGESLSVYNKAEVIGSKTKASQIKATQEGDERKIIFQVRGCWNSVTRLSTHARTNACVYTHSCTLTCTCTHMFTCIHTLSHTHTHTHTLIHSLTHSLTHSHRSPLRTYTLVDNVKNYTIIEKNKK